MNTKGLKLLIVIIVLTIPVVSVMASDGFKILEVGWQEHEGKDIVIPHEGVLTCWVQIQSLSNITLSEEIIPKTSTPDAGAAPSYKFLTLSPGEVVIVDFKITNRGVKEDTVGKVTFTCREKMFGTATDTNDELMFVLKPYQEPEHENEVVNEGNSQGQMWSLIGVGGLIITGLLLYRRRT